MIFVFSLSTPNTFPVFADYDLGKFSMPVSGNMIMLQAARPAGLEVTAAKPREIGQRQCAE